MLPSAVGGVAASSEPEHLEAILPLLPGESCEAEEGNTAAAALRAPSLLEGGGIQGFEPLRAGPKPEPRAAPSPL